MQKVFQFSMQKRISLFSSSIQILVGSSRIKFHDNNLIESLIQKDQQLMDNKNMNETYEIINSVPTHVFTYGRKLGEKFSDDQKELVISITGNPGLAGFYLPFFSTLHQELNELPVWGIGHAGHDDPSSNSGLIVPPMEGNEHLYDLQGQLKHKIEFIKRFVPKDVKLHLIGHSIGSWVVLELLKLPEISDRVIDCQLLFPTIERMAVSPNGVTIVRLWSIWPIFKYVYLFFSYFPFRLKVFLISIYFWFASMPNHFMGTTIKYTKPCVIDKIMLMAMDEMDKIKELDVENLKKNKNRLKLYYGTTDGWVPTSYFHDIIKTIPGINAELCTQGIEHAFVLRSGPTMGRKVAGWILTDKKV